MEALHGGLPGHRLGIAQWPRRGGCGHAEPKDKKINALDTQEFYCTRKKKWMDAVFLSLMPRIDEKKI